MFMNLHTLPAGKSMYTIAVTVQPAGTPKDDIEYDEIDVVAGSRASLKEVISAASAEIEDYGPHARVIGVVDQSAGYVVATRYEGDLR